MNKKVDKKGKYLIYVTKFDMCNKDHRCTVVYEYTGDPFHAMGEISFRSLEQIYSMTFQEDTIERREFWANEDVTITPWIDKY